MGLSNARVQSSNNLSSRPEASSKKVGWVLEVLLDENAEYAKAKKIGAQPIGSIHFKTSDDGVLDTDPASRTIAHPFDKNFKNYFGIIMDDIMAGLYSMLLIYLISLKF